MRPAVLLALALAASIGSARSEQRESTGGTISLDFLALGDEGRPVLDLRPAEVILRVGGRDRAIRSLRLVRLSSTASGETKALPPPFGTNASASTIRWR